MRFTKGKSGNPAGRPKGIPSPQARLREAIEADLPAIIEALVEKAREGDTAAATLLLSRVLPPARPESLTAQVVAAGTSLDERAEAITGAVLSGELPSSTGADLMNLLRSQSQIKEISEFEERLAAIERRLS